MQRANYARTIYLLTTQPKTLHPGVQAAIEQLNLPVPVIEPERLLREYQSDKHKILLLDPCGKWPDSPAIGSPKAYQPVLRNHLV